LKLVQINPPEPQIFFLLFFLSFSFFLGAEGEKGRDYDFLNSVEVLILDQAEIFLMQNWDHILSIFQAGFLLIF